MKNRTKIMPVSGLPQDMKIAAKNIMVLFDDQQQATTIKRLTIIIESSLKGLVIDSMEQIGVIDVIVNDSGFGTSWAIKERGIGLLRKLDSDKFAEKIADPKLKYLFSQIANANENDTITVPIALILAKSYIDEYPLMGGS
jgi:hypothetical protein